MMAVDDERAMVHVVDDERSVREALRWALERDGLRVACHVSGEDFLKSVFESPPSCVILDLKLPGMSGLAVQAALIERHVAAPIIVLSAHLDVPAAVEAMKAGAFDVLQKPVDTGRLLACVRSAVLVEAQRGRAQAERAHVARCLERLTPREAQVLDLIVGACATRDIASTLGISPRTVDVHRAQILAKLEATSIADLVRMVVAFRTASFR